VLKIRPHYFLYMLAASLPLSAFPFLNFETRAITWDWVVLSVLLLVFFVSVAMGKKVKIPRDEVLLFLFLFNFFLMLSGIRPALSENSKQLLDFLTAWPQYVLFSLAFVVIASLRCQASVVRSILQWYLVVAWVVAMFGIIQAISHWLFRVDLYPRLTHVMYTKSESGYEMYLGGLSRAVSIFEEPRQFGEYLDVAFFTTLMSFQWDPPIFRHRWMRRTIFSALLVGILLSLSTSAYLGFVIMAILVIGISGTRLRKRIIMMLLMGLTGGLFFAYILKIKFGVSLGGYLAKRFHTLHHAREILELDVELGGIARYIRGTIIALKVAVENPVFGTGVNQSHYWLSPYESLGPVVMPPFDLLASVGILGTTCFVGFFYALMKRACNIRKQLGEKNRFEIETALGLLGIAVIATLGASWHQYNTSLFWFPVYVATLIIYSMPTWKLRSPVKSNTDEK